jgi:hypothetical protein
MLYEKLEVQQFSAGKTFSRPTFRFNSILSGASPAIPALWAVERRQIRAN